MIQSRHFSLSKTSFNCRSNLSTGGSCFLPMAQIQRTKGYTALRIKMRISIVSIILFLNYLDVFLQLTRAFQTTANGSKPYSGQPSTTKKITTLIHRSPSTILASTSNDEETAPSPSISKSEAEAAESENGGTTTQPVDPKQNQQDPIQRPPGPSVQDLMLAMGTNPRRIFLGLSSATGIALAGNLFGVTSNLLTGIPEEQVEVSGLDTYFPRGNYKRCRTPEYTFVIPKQWVADTFVELAKAQRKIQPLDYSMQQSSQRAKPLQTLPDSAYGPPGRLNQKGVSQAGDTNVSVIVSSGLIGFSLGGTLGTPKEAAETLLTKSIAPEGSGRKATLLRAVDDSSKQTYQFEYIVDRGERGPPLRNIAVIAASPGGDKLYTLTVVAPAEKWKDEDAKLRKIADSFHLRR